MARLPPLATLRGQMKVTANESSLDPKRMGKIHKIMEHSNVVYLFLHVTVQRLILLCVKCTSPPNN